MKKQILSLGAMAIAASLSACMDSSDSNHVQVRIGLDQSTGLARSIAATGTGIELTKATVHLEKIELKSKHIDCDDDTTKVNCKEEESHIKGDTTTINLLDPNAQINFGELPAGNYTRLKLKIDSPNGDSLYAFQVAGTADGKPFRLQYDFDAELQFNSATPIALDNGNLTIAALFKTSTWLDAAAINSCRSKDKVKLLGDTLVITDKTDCSGLESKIKNAIQESGRIEKD